MSGPAKTCPGGPKWAHKGPYGPFLCVLGDLLNISWILGQILKFLIKITCFCASPAKAMQNHLEISSKVIFGPETCEIALKL